MSEDSSDRNVPGNQKSQEWQVKQMVLIGKQSKKTRMTSKTKGFQSKLSKKTRMTSKTNGFHRKTIQKDKNDK